MKKISLLFILFVSFFVFSCKKSNDAVVATHDDKPEQGLPNFDESNSAEYTWDELPAALKNAVSIEKSAEAGNARSSAAAYSSYSYAVGPWGGNGGSPFSIYPPNGSRIYAMGISSGTLIDRIIIWYRTSNGTIYVGGDRGGNGGTLHIQYFAANEYIKYVAGRAGSRLDRLTIGTNIKTFTYGGVGGSPFSAGIPYGYQVLGFFGRSGANIDQIGFWVYTF